MHDIAPFQNWLEEYNSNQDKRSPFYGRVYSEYYENTIYNYYIHPEWDEFGSNTLYAKILFCDYKAGYTIIELLGEWNDALYNDIMFLKDGLVNPLLDAGIRRFILIAENVLNFHASDDCYYEEWWEDIRDDNGWIAILNAMPHVAEEMVSARLQFYMHFGPHFQALIWRPHKPAQVYQIVLRLIQSETKGLSD